MQVRRITNLSLRSEECLGKELGRKTGAREWDRGCAHVKPLSKSDEGTSVLLTDGQNSWRMESRGEWMVIKQAKWAGTTSWRAYELYEGVWTLP